MAAFKQEDNSIEENQIEVPKQESKIESPKVIKAEISELEQENTLGILAENKIQSKEDRVFLNLSNNVKINGLIEKLNELRKDPFMCFSSSSDSSKNIYHKINTEHLLGFLEKTRANDIYQNMKKCVY